MKVTAFKRFALPLFLEGEVHYMRTESDKRKLLRHVRNMRNSGVYDRKLKMFKVNANLDSESLEIGRTRVFNSPLRVPLIRRAPGATAEDAAADKTAPCQSR